MAKVTLWSGVTFAGLGVTLAMPPAELYSAVRTYSRPSITSVFGSATVGLGGSADRRAAGHSK